MQKVKLILRLLLFLSGMGFARPTQAQQVSLRSTAPAIPVLMGQAANPLLRVAIYVPAGAGALSYTALTCQLNKAALPDIRQLDVYYTGREPLFSTTKPLASIRPTTAAFKIPVQLRLQPGMHYLWFSAALEETADSRGQVELHCTHLVDQNRQARRVTEEQGGYTKRIGVPVRRAGDDRVDTYRIPGLATTDKGTLLAVYDIRYDNARDLPGNIDVGLSRSTDGGKTWEPMKVLMDMGAPHQNNGVGDPAILFDPVTKKTWVAALWSKGNKSIAGSRPGLSPEETGQLVLVSSADDGLTWSAPASITPQVKNPDWNLFFNGPGNGTVMQDGTLVFPAQYWDAKGVPHATILYSDDHGSSWKGQLAGPISNTTESQVVETTPGTLMLNMRDNRGGFRSVATTSDLGKSWLEHHTSFRALPDPICMGSLIKAKVQVKGKLRDVLFFSNANNAYSRHNITIQASLDLGESWKPAHQALIDERASYGYSSLTRIDAHTIGILYEGVKDLYFVPVPVSDIIK